MIQGTIKQTTRKSVKKWIQTGILDTLCNSSTALKRVLPNFLVCYW